MFIAIIKTAGPNDAAGRSSAYPVECVQGDSMQDLLEKYPKAKIMPLEAYHGYKQAMNEIHDNKPKPKAWWKFWGV